MKVHDEVCGMTIESETAVGSVSFQGKRYYFCSGRCKQLFSQHPEWYVEVESGPTEISRDDRGG